MCCSCAYFLHSIFSGDLNKHFDSHLWTQKCSALGFESLAVVSQLHSITFCIISEALPMANLNVKIADDCLFHLSVT